MNIPFCRDGEAEKKELEVGELMLWREVEEGSGVHRLGLRQWVCIGKWGLGVRLEGRGCTCQRH